MSFNEDNDRGGVDDEGYCTVCGGSFRGRRGLSSHLYRTPLCSASAEIRRNDGGTPSVGWYVRSPGLGGRNEDDLSNNFATDTLLSDDDLTLPFEEVAVSPSRNAGILLSCEYDTVVVDDASFDSYDSDSVASLLEGRFVHQLPAVNVPVDATVVAEGLVVDAGPDCSVHGHFLELQNAQCDELGIGRLSSEEKLHLDLLHILKSHRLPLNIFSPTLKFALKVNASGVALSDVVPSRKSVISKLFDHYSMHSLAPRQKQCFLPIAKRHVNMVYFDASAVFASLLSCPVLNQDHKYMVPINGMSPFAVGNSTDSCARNYVGEINTGRIYRATYAELVKDPERDMLLPCILGMDKTHVDTSSRLQMEPITVSHGLLKQEFRSLPSAMRILGYINLEPVHYNRKTLPRLNGTRLSLAAARLNDYHAQIDFILRESGFLRLQDLGFNWNLSIGGVVRPVTFRMYVPFIVGDTEGHDRLCGHYTARFKAIKQLCRVCKCPTKLCAYSKGRYNKRYPKEYDRMIGRSDTDGLRDNSQTALLKNGFKDVCFGFRLGNKPQRGIFGACPAEILHLILLGWFKYCMESFVVQAGGAKNGACALYDDLCAKVGKRLMRQSDREVPRTNFPNGFSTVANLKGHEVVGCLVVMLFSLHTSNFRSIFSAKKHTVIGNIGNPDHITDWILLLESLLQWHEWLKQPVMKRYMVSRSEKANRWLMRLFQNVSPRESGMKNNTVKMHLVVHLAEDILDHGVPQNMNSAFTESAHIPLAKDTSRNTQKRAASFTFQAANRYVENLAMDLAFDEYVGMDSSGTNIEIGAVPIVSNKVSGRFVLRAKSPSSVDKQPLTCVWSGQNRAKEQKKGLLKVPTSVTSFVWKEILSKLPRECEVSCYTEFEVPNKDGISRQVYRAHPYYQSKPWFDYATVRWTSDLPEKFVDLPARIHTFVDLTDPRVAAVVTCNGNHARNRMDHGIYALIESYDRDLADESLATSSTIIGVFHRTEKEVGQPTLYLVSTDCIVGPLFGMADVHYSGAAGVVSPPRYLFFLNGRGKWASCWEERMRMYCDPTESESEEEGDAEGVSRKRTRV